MGELFAWITIAGVPVLIGVGIWCLRHCEGRVRTCLAVNAVVFLIALTLHSGGYIVLGRFGLAWRNLPGLVLWMVLAGSFLVWIVLALYCFLPQVGWIGWVNKGIMILFATVTFLGILWVGVIVLAFGYGGTERVLEYQGQTLLEVDDGFSDRYYAYRGPLVRGTERLYGSETPVCGDTD